MCSSLSIQESVDKALKKLNEEKNIINSDIDMIRNDIDGQNQIIMILMIRNDIRTNENSRRNQDSIFTNKLDQLKQKQIGRMTMVADGGQGEVWGHSEEYT